MFGVGAQELALVFLLCLLVFGPGRLPAIARDLGRFASGARDAFEDVKSGLDRDPEREGDEGELQDDGYDEFAEELGGEPREPAFGGRGFGAT